MASGQTSFIVQQEIGDDRKNNISVDALYQILEKQEKRCALTGILLTPETASLDHATSLAKGGKHELENLQFVLSQVNRAKGTMGNDEFIEMCRCVVSYQDTKRPKGTSQPT